MGIPLEELIRRGAQPVAAASVSPTPPRRRLTADELIAAGAKPAEDDGPGAFQATVRGGAQGITLGTGDEAVGFMQALANRFPVVRLTSPIAFAAHLASGRPVKEFFTDYLDDQAKVNAGRGPTLGDAYRMQRDSQRQDNDEAKAAHPNYYFGGELAGGALVPMPGGAAAKGASLGARLLRAGAQGVALGAGYGFGNSRADVTRGEVGQAAADTGVGALFGGAAGAATEGLMAGGGWALDKLRSKASAGIKEAVAAETAAKEALAEKSIRGATGEYRSAVQSASRDLEVLERAATAMGDTPAGQEAAAYLASEEGRALRESVAKNKLSTAPERIAEMEAKRKALAALVASKDESIQAMVNEGLRDPGKKHIAPRLLYMAKNAMPLALGALGHTFGGLEGAGVGAGIGTLYSMVRGSPARTIANMAKTPGVRKAFWESVLNASGGGLREGSQIAAALQQAAMSGEASFAETAARLSTESPLAQRILKLVAGRDDDQQPRFADSRRP